MPNYLVSYDLDKPGPQDYAKIDDQLKAMGATRVLYSQWLVKSPLPVVSLEQELLKYIDQSTDSFLVVEITKLGSAWNKLRISDDDFRKLLA